MLLAFTLALGAFVFAPATPIVIAAPSVGPARPCPSARRRTIAPKISTSEVPGRRLRTNGDLRDAQDPGVLRGAAHQQASGADLESAKALDPRQTSPRPCPSASPSLPEIGRVNAPGRGTVSIGKTLSASQGTISQAEIATRPIARPGEVLEAIPGLIITQHSGEGKANQYYLRGFQLDHGTDLSATIVGEPINFPTHAHGQGYSDINWLLSEVVSFV